MKEAYMQVFLPGFLIFGVLTGRLCLITRLWRSQYEGTALSAVAAVNTQDVWAVGQFRTGHTSRFYDVLVLHWNGQAWQQIDAPSLLFGSQLGALAALSASDIWAVGSTYSNNNSNTQTLIEHWNESQWQAVKSPNPGEPAPPVPIA